MPTWNNFGATEAMALRRFALSGYVPTAADFGGTDAVADALADAAGEIIQAMPSARLAELQHPEFLVVVNRAADGQSAFTIPAGWRPMVAGSLHVWRGQPQAFVSRPIYRTNPWGAGGDMPLPVPTPTPPGAAMELEESRFSVGGDGYTVTLDAPLARNDQVVVALDVDVASASYTIPSLAGVVATGAAAALGAKVYPQASAEWILVDRLAQQFADHVAGIARGAIVPAEVRSAVWWKAPDTTESMSMSSVRMYRG